MGWIPESTSIDALLTTKGDVVVHNGTDAVRLPVGSNDQVLTADSAQTEGVKWAAGGGGGGSGGSVAVARVETSEGTTSSSLTDLTTSGPAVTVTVSASGVLVVSLGVLMTTNDGTGGALMAFALSGGNTLAANDNRSIAVWRPDASLPGQRLGRTFVLTGLTEGSTTVTAKYRRMNAGTATFAERELSATVGLGAA